jgi:hypothetical protein
MLQSGDEPLSSKTYYEDFLRRRGTPGSTVGRAAMMTKSNMTERDKHLERLGVLVHQGPNSHEAGSLLTD